MHKTTPRLLSIALCAFAFDASARFVSTDPVQADPNAGDNFNRYWYANNNPYKFTDPDGRQSCLICRNPVAFINEGMKSPEAQKSLSNAVTTVTATNAVLAAPLAAPLLVAAAPAATLTVQTAAADVAIGVMSNPQTVATVGAVVADVVAGYFGDGPPPMTRAGAAGFLASQAVTLVETSMPAQQTNTSTTATSEIPDPPDKLVEPR